jgi:hypothetical protein
MSFSEDRAWSLEKDFLFGVPDEYMTSGVARIYSDKFCVSFSVLS